MYLPSVTTAFTAETKTTMKANFRINILKSVNIRKKEKNEDSKCLLIGAYRFEKNYMEIFLIILSDLEWSTVNNSFMNISVESAVENSENFFDKLHFYTNYHDILILNSWWWSFKGKKFHDMIIRYWYLLSITTFRQYYLSHYEN